METLENKELEESKSTEVGDLDDLIGALGGKGEKEEEGDSRIDTVIPTDVDLGPKDATEWLTIDPSSGTGGASLALSGLKYLGREDRVAKVTIKGDGTFTGDTFLVHQKGYGEYIYGDEKALREPVSESGETVEVEFYSNAKALNLKVTKTWLSDSSTTWETVDDTSNWLDSVVFKIKTTNEGEFDKELTPEESVGPDEDWGATGLYCAKAAITFKAYDAKGGALYHFTIKTPDEHKTFEFEFWQESSEDYAFIREHDLYIGYDGKAISANPALYAKGDCSWTTEKANYTEE